jgi:oligopeptidase A
MNNPLLDTSSLPRFDEILPEHVMPAIENIIAEHRSRLNELLDTN